MNNKRIITFSERYTTLAELCELTLDHLLSEDAIAKTAGSYLHDKTVVRILASALPEDSTLCVEKHAKDTGNTVFRSRGCVLIYS